MSKEPIYCPFCGSVHVTIPRGGAPECQGCGAMGPEWDFPPGDDVAAWNRRAIPPEVKALVEAAQELSDAWEEASRDSAWKALDGRLVDIVRKARIAKAGVKRLYSL